jgi:hypothetical protein
MLARLACGDVLLSYLRLAAVGLASVYLAIVANELGRQAPLLIGIVIRDGQLVALIATAADAAGRQRPNIVSALSSELTGHSLTDPGRSRMSDRYSGSDGHATGCAWATPAAHG